MKLVLVCFVVLAVAFAPALAQQTDEDQSVSLPADSSEQDPVLAEEQWRHPHHHRHHSRHHSHGSHHLHHRLSKLQRQVQMLHRLVAHAIRSRSSRVRSRCHSLVRRLAAKLHSWRVRARAAQNNGPNNLTLFKELQQQILNAEHRMAKESEAKSYARREQFLREKRLDRQENAEKYKLRHQWAAKKRTHSTSAVASGSAHCHCPQTVNHVCGADGQTYLNHCAARCNGAMIVRSGACGASASRGSGRRRGGRRRCPRCRRRRGGRGGRGHGGHGGGYGGGYGGGHGGFGGWGHGGHGGYGGGGWGHGGGGYGGGEGGYGGWGRRRFHGGWQMPWPYRR